MNGGDIKTVFSSIVSALSSASADLPSMLSYKTIADGESLYNTPPCFGIYILGLVLKWLKKAGGVSGLRDQLGEPFRFFEFDGGLLIQAGPMPQMGDSNRELSVPEYRRLAQLLKSIRVTDHKAFPAWSGFDAGRTTSWLARFD